MANKHQKVSQRRARIAVYGLVALCLIVIAGNAAVAFAYRGRVLPHTYLGKMNISGWPLKTLATAPTADILPARLEFTKASTTTWMTPDQLGLSVDIAASLHTANPIRQWLPVTSLIAHYEVPLHLHYAPTAYRQAVETLAKRFLVPATQQHVAFSGTTFAIAPANSGYRLDDAQLADIVSRALQRGISTITVPTLPLAAPVGSSVAASEVQRLQQRLDTSIQFVYRGRTVRASKADIGSWFVPAGQMMALSTSAARTYIDKLGQQLGTTIANPDDLAAAAIYAAGKGLSHSLAVVPAGGSTIVRTYCTAVREADPSVLTDLTGKLAATYNDVSGWNNDGRIAFVHVASGCQYTVWMSASSQMTSFGAICDPYYNCQIGTNVILNYDRWVSATNPWNQTGGSLEDYRTLMIDHETGHRLGFLDNPICPATGQPAPVMMQQSMNLKGCTFNIWPRPVELAQLDAVLGLPVPNGAISE